MTALNTNTEPFMQELPCYSLKPQPINLMHLGRYFVFWVPSFTCREGVAVCTPLPPGNVPSPAGCLTIQLNSDTIWRQQIPWVQGSVLWDCPLQMPAASPGCWLCFYQLGTNWRFQQPPPTQDANPKSRSLPELLTGLYIRGSQDPLLGFN